MAILMLADCRYAHWFFAHFSQNLQNIPKAPMSIKYEEDVDVDDLPSEESINIRDSFFTAKG